VLATDDPVSCAIYAKKHNLLLLPGWKQFKRIAKEHEEIKQLVFKAKLKAKFKTTKFTYGFKVPNNHLDAVLLDKSAGNELWKESEESEINALGI
jgi:hypothetical protein